MRISGFLAFVFLLMSAATAAGQEVGKQEVGKLEVGERRGDLIVQASPPAYKISYVDERKLFRKGDVVTLTSLYLEWPERLNGSSVPVLQSYLFHCLFGVESQNDKNKMASVKVASLDQVRCDFYKDLGTEIDVMPEGENVKRQYINLTLTEEAWDKDRYISLMARVEQRDGDQPKAKVNQLWLLTYDIAAEKVLTTRDLVKREYLVDRMYNEEFIHLLLGYLPSTVSTVNIDDLPDQSCLLNRRRGMLYNVQDGNGEIYLLEVVYTSILNNCLTKRAWQLLSGETLKPRKKHLMAEIEMADVETTDDGQPIYLVTDSLPRYPGGVKELGAFMMRQAVYPELEQRYEVDGKVVVSFVVGKDGRISRPAVIFPVSPGLDRAAVKAVMDMQPWIPGKMLGKPVNVRMTLPVQFRARPSK